MRELQRRVRAGQSVSPFEPCLPRVADAPPAGPGWIHEIKYDGFRILAHRRGRAVRLVARNGDDLAGRYPVIVDAVRGLPIKSCIIDGEAIVVDEEGLSVFDLLRYRRHDHAATLCAFDLIEIDGRDLRPHPIEERKEYLSRLIQHRDHGVAINEIYSGDAATIYKHACALGCEGIVSKRLGSRYRAGRSGDWLEIRNPEAPAVRRLEEEDWS
jgi:bifunctional non-homologous end joining protein LigD